MTLPDLSLIVSHSLTLSLSLVYSCNDCLRDWFAPAIGLPTCSQCDTNAGEFSAPGSPLCSKCPAGTKTVRGLTATTCVKCSYPEGTSLVVPASQLPEDIKTANIGMFQENTGASDCKHCPAGYATNKQNGLAYWYVLLLLLSIRVTFLFLFLTRQPHFLFVFSF